MSLCSRHIFPIFLSLTVLGVGCSDNASSTTDSFSTPPDSEGQLSIESPAEGDLLTVSPVNVTGGASGLSQITINGENFPVEDGRYSATVRLNDGVQAITVSGQNARSQSVTVTVDINPPFIDLSLIHI